MCLIEALFSPEVAAVLVAGFGPAALIYAPTRRMRRLLAELEAVPHSVETEPVVTEATASQAP